MLLLTKQGKNKILSLYKIFYFSLLLFFISSCIILLAVTLIAMKREVAVCHTQVFRGAKVMLETGDKSLYTIQLLLLGR